MSNLIVLNLSDITPKFGKDSTWDQVPVIVQRLTEEVSTQFIPSPKYSSYYQTVKKSFAQGKREQIIDADFIKIRLE